MECQGFAAINIQQDLYWLYTVPHEPLPDPKADFDFWEVHVWQGFEDLLNDLMRHGVLAPDRTVLDGRMRLPGETRPAFRNRTAARVSNRYDASKSGLQSLSFDLAVLLANYVVDRHLIGGDALAAFNAESLTQREKIEAGWKRSCRQLGLSWRKQLRQDKDGVDFSRPFRVVGADLALISAAQIGGTHRHIAESTPKEPPPTQSPNGALADRREKKTLNVVSESSLEEIQTAHSDNVPATASNAECERSENGNRAGSPEDWLQRFIQEQPGTTLADIKYSANIHTAEFQDWRRGELKTSSVMSERIEKVLSGATPLKKKPSKRRAE